MNELLDCYLPVFRRVLHIIAEPTSFADYAQTRLSCLVTLEQAIHHTGGLDAPEKEKEAARFAVIAWLDETILCSTLPWRQRWQGELLQRKYLNMTIAGERFFTHLTQLDPAYRQARTVFLFCLQNGFHGQYSTPTGEEALQEVIAEQRALCLPEDWQTWPNTTEITPLSGGESVLMPFRKRLVLKMPLALASMYGVLFLILHHYAS